MEGNVKFNFSVANDLIYRLTICRENIVDEHDKMQDNFSALNEHFKDAYYQEFLVEFEKGERTVKKVNEDMRDLTVSLIQYAKELGELERGGIV